MWCPHSAQFWFVSLRSLGLCVCVRVYRVALSWWMNEAGAIHCTCLKTLGFQKARGRLLAARSARGNGGSGPR